MLFGLQAGDKVVAIRDGGHDRAGQPVQRPKRGTVYTITSIYLMKYGAGCTLEGMNPAPYRGYLLFVDRPFGDTRRGWYFRKVEAAEPEFTEQIKRLASKYVTASASRAAVLCCARRPGLATASGRSSARKAVQHETLLNPSLLDTQRPTELAPASAGASFGCAEYD